MFGILTSVVADVTRYQPARNTLYALTRRDHVALRLIELFQVNSMWNSGGIRRNTGTPGEPMSHFTVYWDGWDGVLPVKEARTVNPLSQHDHVELRLIVVRQRRVLHGATRCYGATYNLPVRQAASSSAVPHGHLLCSLMLGGFLISPSVQG